MNKESIGLHSNKADISEGKVKETGSQNISEEKVKETNLTKSNSQKVAHGKWLSLAMISGILGCLCYGGGDWLMIYADATYQGTLSWLTNGVAQIPAWRNNLSMLLAFPGIIFYGIALFYLGTMILPEKEKKVYHYLNAFGLTPWMCLHIFYVMILYLYAWMTKQGYGEIALAACEAVYHHFSWVVIVSEAMMLPVFLYWFYVVISGKTVLPRKAAWGNVLVFYAILKGVTMLMPQSAFQIACTNGLMSESMLLFLVLIWISLKRKEKE